MAESCSGVDCGERVITKLGERDLCLRHFCSHCYELLERASGWTGHHAADAAFLRKQLCTLDECSRKALEISLSPAQLSNLDRARLLDILLWTGDVTSMLQRGRTGQLALSNVCEATETDMGEPAKSGRDQAS